MRRQWFILLGMAQIFLTQAIDNSDGYIDDVVSQIMAIPADEPLEMLITCEGGDVFQGARLHRAVLEHNGSTNAVVIGLAASMGGVLLSAFDTVEIDNEADIMLHKAHIPEAKPEDVTLEQSAMIARFNKRAYGRMLSAGVNEEFLNEVFLSNSNADVWLTASEAQEMGIGKVVKIERRDSKPFKVAASLDINKLKNKTNNMGIFDKPVMRVLTVSDGRQIVFNSKKEDLQKGDKISLVGSGDSLKGELRLSASLVAEIGDDNEVKAVNEVAAPVAEIDPQSFADLQAMVADLQTAVQGIIDAMGSKEAEEVTPDAAVTAQLSAIDEKAKELENSTATVKALLESTLKAAATISSSFKLEKPENKSEKIFSGLTAQQEQAKKLRAVLTAK
jgi:ATP-dependent protease ClpP protease subunit